MDISIKDTLRTLRSNKNVTQEALAKHLGITPQSVGKWERGEGLPDIILLPKIALYFGITVDELLNVDEARIEEKITSYKIESHRIMRSGDADKNLALWEKAYAEFPSDCRVKSELMYATAMFPLTEESTKRIISLGEQILAESTDGSLREHAVQQLCYTYDRAGDKGNALRYANMGGETYISKQHLRSKVLDGEEGIKECQDYVLMLFSMVDSTAYAMVHNAKLTSEEKIGICEFIIKLFKLLFEDDISGFYAGMVARNYSLISREYANLCDSENVIKALQQCVEYAVTDSDEKEKQFTALMLNRLKYNPDYVLKTGKGNACDYCLREFRNNCYDFVRDDERFKKAIDTLQAHALEA